MSELTPASSLAWKIAAAEASAARHEFIELSHFLIGVLSLEKVVHDAPAALALPKLVKQEVQRENTRLEELLERVSLRATGLRRSLRDALGSGGHAPAGRPISRSAALKAAFRRARALAKGGPIECVHLLAALLEKPDAALEKALGDCHARAPDLHQKVLAFVEGAGTAKAGMARILEPMLDKLTRAVQQKHGLSLKLTPDAFSFVAAQGGSSAEEMQRAVERLVQSPLEALVKTGKIRKHAAWQLVYDEGGVYLVPQEPKK